MAVDAFALGVDFGTSNTVAVLSWPDGRVKPLFFDGSPTLLSGVFADPGGTLFTGRDAAHAARSMPECFEPHPKRRIDDGTILLGTAEFPVAEVVAAVLDRVRAEASRISGRAIDTVTLTCPAAWGSHRRQVLLDAAAKAGLGVPQLVAEPVAAASYFLAIPGIGLPVGSCIVVYDFGAGTFDASVVRRDPDGFVVLATEGLPDAGGLDVDAAIFAHLGAVYSGRDPQAWARLELADSVASRRVRRALWEDIRTAKEMLSRAATTLIPIPSLDEDAPLGREQFDRLAGPVVERTVGATRAALRAARIAEQDVTGIYLVGGSSRIPLVATMLHRAFRIAPTVIEQPELVVAEGSLYSLPQPAEPVAVPAASAATPTEPVAVPVPPGAGSAVGSAKVPPSGTAPRSIPTLESSSREATRPVLPLALPILGILLVSGAVGALAAGDGSVIGVDIVLAVLLTPALPGVLLLALAGVGVPAAQASPGPVRWALVHASWAAAGVVAVALELLWLSYWPDDWPGFQVWYASAVWVTILFGLLFFLMCGWWLARRTFQDDHRRASSRLVRARGYLVAALVGGACPVWWLASAAPLRPHNRCVWATTANDACDAGGMIWHTGGPVVIFGWLALVLGAFVFVALVGLLAAVLRMLFAERLRTSRSWLVQLAVALLGLSGVGLAYLGVDSHQVALGKPGLPSVGLLRELQAPSISADYSVPIAVGILFVLMLAVALAVQSARRRGWPRRAG